MMKTPGKIWLIGAGPGDVELLTLKAVRALGEAQVWLVSDMAPEFVRSIYLRPFAAVQAALDAALAQQGHGASVAVLPFAGSTLPVIGVPDA